MKKNKTWIIFASLVFAVLILWTVIDALRTKAYINDAQEEFQQNLQMLQKETDAFLSDAKTLQVKISVYAPGWDLHKNWNDLTSDERPRTITAATVCIDRKQERIQIHYTSQEFQHEKGSPLWKNEDFRPYHETIWIENKTCYFVSNQGGTVKWETTKDAARIQAVETVFYLKDASLLRNLGSAVPSGEVQHNGSMISLSYNVNNAPFYTMIQKAVPYEPVNTIKLADGTTAAGDWNNNVGVSFDCNMGEAITVSNFSISIPGYAVRKIYYETGKNYMFIEPDTGIPFIINIEEVQKNVPSEISLPK